MLQINIYPGKKQKHIYGQGDKLMEPICCQIKLLI